MSYVKVHQMHIEVRVAEIQDAKHIAEMGVSLTEEISTQHGAKQFNLSHANTSSLFRELLIEGKYVALIALVEGVPAGFVGLSEGRALYAEGALATMQEFFVTPAFRALGIGSALIEAAIKLAKERGWRRLEVCTPPLPQFELSLVFYEKNGFEITGGRKLKRLL